jgi:hypothetical protein
LLDPERAKARPRLRGVADDAHRTGSRLRAAPPERFTVSDALRGLRLHRTDDVVDRYASSTAVHRDSRGHELWVFSIGAEDPLLRAAHCGSSECSPVSTMLVGAADPDHAYRLTTGNRQSAPSVFLKRKQLGSEYTDAVLQLITCDPYQCSGTPADPPLTLNTSYIVVASGRSKRAVFAFNDSRTDALNLASCEDSSCTSTRIVEVGKGAPYDLAMDPDDLPLLVSSGSREGLLRVTRCHDRACSSLTSAVIDQRSGIPRPSGGRHAHAGAPDQAMTDASSEEPLRELTELERGDLARLLTVDFPGREAVARQLESVLARRIDEEGRVALVTQSSEPAKVTKRVPVEGESSDTDGTTRR